MAKNSKARRAAKRHNHAENPEKSPASRRSKKLPNVPYKRPDGKIVFLPKAVGSFNTKAFKDLVYQEFSQYTPMTWDEADREIYGTGSNE